MLEYCCDSSRSTGRYSANWPPTEVNTVLSWAVDSKQFYRFHLKLFRTRRDFPCPEKPRVPSPETTEMIWHTGIWRILKHLVASREYYIYYMTSKAVAKWNMATATFPPSGFDYLFICFSGLPLYSKRMVYGKTQILVPALVVMAFEP